MRFVHDLGGGYALALRTPDTVAEMHRLTLKNLDRLREWEPWAQGEQSLEATASFTGMQLERFAAGTLLPTAIARDGVLIGSASLRLDSYLGTAELGYWIDEEEQGKGVVFRACTALLDHAREAGAARVEIRTAVANVRSRRLAERLGFIHEGTLRAALPIGETRLDVALYGLVAKHDDVF
ncbi:GNAT family N-acetyltransferase [Microbacterium sp. SORGH_AS_0888]|uniref:GNAT family N-acetyltransferase n=1 Tax=Microbacterium sp. SORGH_AS_0888 TaxID=3041791 RepID=UPI002782D8EB|nr:GNAT family protein [Microbacterium sp. SORGH_AS_0888]MDQ1128044.1 ribosomal-protein-serine acetyltransferase [Microbacterium sp. SORGH_AS_0888]